MTMTRFVFRQRGLTITELMVSVAISIVVLSALVYVYVGSRGAYRTNEAVARVQETGRFAIEWIARDLRSAGYLGCASRVTELVISTTTPGASLFGAALFGHENANNFANPTNVPFLRGDVVIITKLDDGAIVRVVEQDATNANIKVTPQAPFQRGDDLVATDCQRAVLFNATTVTSGGSCNVGGGPFGCTTIAHASGNTNSTMRSFGRDGRATVSRLSRIGYFIGTNRGGRPALYRFQVNGPTEEVVENVEDIDFLYGVDTDSNGAVDAYLDANAVTAADRWGDVLSVRVSLVAVSSEQAATPRRQEIYLRDQDGDTVVDPSTPLGSGDRRLRQTFTSTVALRNRLS